MLSSGNNDNFKKVAGWCQGVGWMWKTIFKSQSRDIVNDLGALSSFCVALLHQDKGLKKGEGIKQINILKRGKATIKFISKR